MHEHLEFIRRATKAHLRAEVVEKLRTSVARIEARMADPCLYVAVVGEFSAGKSTFANALLRESLLPASILPTTTAITELRSGPPDIAVRLDDEDWRSTQSWSTLCDLRALTGEHKVPRERRELLSLLMSNARLGQHLKGVRITQACPLLDSGVVVLDTPGIDHTERNTSLVEKVVAEQADAFVVCMLAKKLLTQTILRLLSGPLRPHLDRCIFLITRMASVDKDERDELLEHGRRRIAQELGIRDPLLLTCSVGAVVRALEGRDELSPVEREWAEAFPALESELRTRLLQRREIDIAASVRVAIEQLLDELTDALEEARRSLDTRDRALEALRVEPIEEVAEELRNHVEDSMLLARRNAFDWADDHLARAADLLQQHIARMIRDAPSREALVTAPQQIRALIGTMDSDLTLSAGASLEVLNKAANAQAAAIHKRFEVAYESVADRGRPRLTRRGVTPEIAGRLISAVTAVPDAAFGGSLSGRARLDGDRDAYSTALCTALDDGFEKIKASVRTHLGIASTKLADQLNNRIDAYLAAYGPAVAAAANRYRRERDDLMVVQADLLALLDEAATRVTHVRGATHAAF